MQAGVPKPQNTKGVCWFRTEKSVEKGARTQIFSRPVPEDKGTYGFIQRVLAGAQRAISTQKKIDPETGRSQNHERGGALHHVVTWRILTLSVCAHRWNFIKTHGFFERFQQEIEELL